MQIQNSIKRVINSATISIQNILNMKYSRDTANKRNEKKNGNTIIPSLFKKSVSGYIIQVQHKRKSREISDVIYIYIYCHV